MPTSHLSPQRYSLDVNETFISFYQEQNFLKKPGNFPLFSHALNQLNRV